MPDNPIASAQSGFFRDDATWVGGTAPTTSDQWMVCAGHVVTVDQDVLWAAETGPQGEIELGGLVIINQGAVATLSCGDIKNNGVLRVEGAFVAEAINWTLLSVGRVVLGPCGELRHSHPLGTPTTLITFSAARQLGLLGPDGRLYLPAEWGLSFAEAPGSISQYDVPFLDKGILLQVRRVGPIGQPLVLDGFHAVRGVFRWNTDGHNPPTTQSSTMSFGVRLRFARGVSARGGGGARIEY